MQAEAEVAHALLCVVRIIRWPHRTLCEGETAATFVSPFGDIASILNAKLGYGSEAGERMREWW